MTTDPPIESSKVLLALHERLRELDHLRPLADPLDWWSARARLLDAVLSAVEATDAHPLAEAASRQRASRALTQTRTDYHLACSATHQIAAERHERLADPSLREYRVYRRPAGGGLIDELVGVCATLTTAMDRADHPNPTDWTAVAPDIIAGARPWSNLQGRSWRWSIRATRVSHEHLELLTATLAAGDQPGPGHPAKDPQ